MARRYYILDQKHKTKLYEAQSRCDHHIQGYNRIECKGCSHKKRESKFLTNAENGPIKDYILVRTNFNSFILKHDWQHDPIPLL